MTRRIPLVALLIAALSGVGVILQAAADQKASDAYQRYDDQFRKYTKKYFGDGFDWRFFKAQALVESNLKPTVSSSSGARGLMQIMPATYAEAKRRNKDLGDISNPESNIAAGIWYAHEAWNFWDKGSDRKFRRQFMLGSYNAGHAPLMRAQKVAVSQKMNEKRWPTIEKVAPKVSNWRYKETLAYVGSVFANLSSLDRNGRVKGPTISKDNGDGSRLPDKLKSFLGLFKHLKFWDDDDN